MKGGATRGREAPMHHRMALITVEGGEDMNHIRTTSRTRRALLAVFVGAALVAALAGTAGSSSGAVVTSGAFHAFAAGAGMDISGRAHTVRTADGRTIVAIQVQGLNPNTTYGSHVHAA